MSTRLIVPSGAGTTHIPFNTKVSKLVEDLFPGLKIISEPPLQGFTTPPPDPDPIVKTPPPLQILWVKVPPSTTAEPTTPTALSLTRVEPIAIEVIQPAIVKTYPRVEAKSPSLLQNHHGLSPQRQHNCIFHHQVDRYLLEKHIFNNHMAMHVYNAMEKSETVYSLIYGYKGKTWERSLIN